MKNTYETTVHGCRSDIISRTEEYMVARVQGRTNLGTTLNFDCTLYIQTV
jgi:hypothetical protein